MSLIVQKFGGSSFSDAESIKRVAKRIVATRRAGNDVVVAVSAMGDTTDELLGLAHEVSPLPDPRRVVKLFIDGRAPNQSVENRPPTCARTASLTVAGPPRITFRIGCMRTTSPTTASESSDGSDSKIGPKWSSAPAGAPRESASGKY